MFLTNVTFSMTDGSKCGVAGRRVPFFSRPAGVEELHECLSTLNGPAYKQRNHVVLVNRLDYDYKLSSATKPQNYSPEFSGFV